MNEDQYYDHVFRMGLDDGRRDATRKPDVLLRNKGFDLANGNDIYAIGFRQGFRESGGKD